MGAFQESRLFPGRGSIGGCTFPRARRIPWHRVWEICPKLRNGHRWPTSAVSVDSRGKREGEFLEGLQNREISWLLKFVVCVSHSVICHLFCCKPLPQVCYGNIIQGFFGGTSIYRLHLEFVDDLSSQACVQETMVILLGFRPISLNPDVWRKSPGTLGEMIDFQSIPHHALSRIIHHYHPLLDSGIVSNVMAHYTHKAKSFAAMPLAPPRWPSEPVASCEGSQYLLNGIINVDINGYTWI